MLRGQLIAEPGGFVSSAIHSSVSGTVKTIEPRTLATGGKCMSVIIENDGKEEETEFHPASLETLTKDEILQRIREEEKAYLLQSVHKEEDLDALLESKDPYLALGALSQIGKEGIQGHEEALEKLLVSPSSPHDVKVFALEVLVAHDYPKEVTYLDMDSRVTLVPKDAENPFEERNALSLRKLLATLSDVSLASVCTQLLDQLALSCFPSYPFSGKPLSLESEALISLGREYLGQAQEEISEEAEQEKTRFKVLLSRYPRLP